MKKITLFCCIILSALWSCKKGDAYRCGSNPNAQEINVDGLNREYIVYVPSTYDGATKVPLVFNFHGFGDAASEYLNTADLRQISEAEQCILVYPQGSCSDGLSHWNPCPLGGDNKSTTDDMNFIDVLLSTLSEQYNVDLKRVYAVGYSNGGMMAYGLANYKSDKIAAVASVSGAMLDCIGPKSRPVPVAHFHGTADVVIPYNGSSDYNSVQSTLNHWVSFNNADTVASVSTSTQGANTIEHHVYGNGDDSVTVEHYKYIGGNHIWFEARFQEQSTAELVWKFLSKYDINGLR